MFFIFFNFFNNNKFKYIDLVFRHLLKLIFVSSFIFKLTKIVYQLFIKKIIINSISTIY